MKALLVDDEKHVRDAIRLLGHWEEFGIDTLLEAADGDEAIAAITAHQPQIILSDMRMPGKDGMALLEWISAHTPHSKVLVISGYDDFELVRHAIRHGGMDYLLKPVEADELNASLLKAVTAWEEEDAIRIQSTRQSIVVNRMRPHYQDRLLTELAVGRGSSQSHMQRLQDELNLPRLISVCSVAVTSLSHLDADCLAKYRSQPDLLVFSVLNICAEMLSTPDEGVMFRQLDQPDEIVLLHWGPSTSLEHILDKVNHGLEQTIQRRLHFGISTCESYPGGISAAYLEASSRLWRRNAVQIKQRIHASVESSNGNKIRRLTAHEEPLRMAAMSCRASSVATAVAEWIDPITDLEVVSAEQIQQWIEELEWMLSRWLDDTAGSSFKEEEVTEEQSIPFAELPLDAEGLLSFPLLRSLLEQRLLAAGKALTAHHHANPDPMSEIARYMDAHYQEDLSLQQIAARFYLSREYISRKFKQQFGLNWSEYLGKLRINNAKLLLQNPSLRVAKISEMVGFQDEKYFSKVFKKMEGITPAEYRKTLLEAGT
ncbi:response regulator [Paenibacillus sp. W2I17]|uniref:response regulator transcription factor n=1 Tax=Paenibacillus sp. W2I17 TaxID=3042311 RepID=UPI0027815F88|nr:response regulator [Paenibacillus sp. W2I17]MDQ0658864.1 two-component system response regulator YesN [Paenibacillus sp. W2I17]